MVHQVITGMLLTKSPFGRKDENIGFDEYIGTWILQIYRRYIGGYFYMNIDISEIKLL